MEGSHKSSTGSALDIFLHLRQMLISEYDNWNRNVAAVGNVFTAECEQR
jgi:hypothetical protein